VIVFLEGGIEDLMRSFHAPVAPGDEQPMVGGEADTWQA
jgi:hypothetical protein